MSNQVKDNEQREIKPLLYFGCIGDKGHYLWRSQGETSYTLHREAKEFGLPENFFKFLDGNFVPTETRKQGIYRTSQIGSAQIISWHDYSLDSRPGSNSILIGRGFENEEDMIDEAIKKFPSVMNRQPRPIRYSSEPIVK